MLIDVERLIKLYPNKGFEKLDKEQLENKLNSIEVAIRSYTHNNFQNRNIRMYCISRENKLHCDSKNLFIKKGDTIQISKSDVNDGLYVVVEATEIYLEVDKEIFPTINFVTKVQYPLDIIDGAVELLDWSINKSDKVGIASESLSRKSTSYQQYDGTNTINGYPSMLFGFCKPYMKAKR